MKRIVLILFLMLFGAQVQAQSLKNSVDTLQLIHTSDWRPYSSKFGDSLLVFRAVDRLDAPDVDTSGWSKAAKDSIGWVILRMNERAFYGQRLSFDEKGGSSFTHYMECKVGETVYSVTPFQFHSKQMRIEVVKRPWDATPTVKTYTYNVEQLSSKQLVLRKITE